MLYDIESSKEITAGSSKTLFSFIVPEKNILIFKKFGNQLSDTGAYGSVIFRIKINGNPVFPYHYITDQVGYLAMPKEITEFKLLPYDKVEIDAINNYGSAITAGIVFQYELYEKD